MYPKKKPKTDEERFHEIFTKKVGTTPGAYLRRKLAAGVPEGELRRMYDMLAVELARTAHCKAIRFDEALGSRTRRASTPSGRRTAACPCARNAGRRWCCAPGRAAHGRGRNSGAARTIRPAGIRRMWSRADEKFQDDAQL